MKSLNPKKNIEKKEKSKIFVCDTEVVLVKSIFLKEF